MQAIIHGCFEDPQREARYQRTARTFRLPFVRVYSVLFMLVALAYSIVNPQFVTSEENARLAILLGCSLLVAGGHVALTYLRDYPDLPLIDFMALFAQAILIAHVNLILFDHLIELHEAMHAVGVINRLAISAFAAVALAGRRRMFLVWMALDAALFLVLVVPIQQHGAGFWYALMSYASGAVIMLAVNLAIERPSRAAFAVSEALDDERARNEKLVHNMLPKAAVQRIRDGKMVADSYADASVIFIDMVGFSVMSKRVSPGHLVELLNAFFSHADRCAAEIGVEKVKTIGDAYLAVAGANIPCRNSADTAIAFAHAVLDGMRGFEAQFGVPVAVRVGIHSGPVVGGVIGESRMAYDFWGDTVNVAARLEGTAPAGGIAISESTWLRTRERSHFGPPHQETLKGVGDLCVYHTIKGDVRAQTGSSMPDGPVSIAAA